MSRTRKQKKTGFSDDWATARDCLGPDGKLSVIMPVYNLGPSIGTNSDRVRTLLEGCVPFELVLVDDGSVDNTADALRLAAARNPETVRPVLLDANVGKGAALRAGLAACSGSHVLLLDGDLDLSPEKIPTFFTVMRAERADIVIGSKRHPQSQIDYPWHRRLASWVYFTLVRILVGLPVTDTQTGMKLFRREALTWAFERMLCKRFAFDLEMLSICHAKGFRVAEAPIRMEFGNKVGCLSFATVKHVMTDTLAIFYRLRILRYYPSVEVHPMPDPPPLISIVIACPAPSPYLDECLAGIARQTYTGIETLVLPDAPTVLAAPASIGLRVMPTGAIRPSEKRNIGIREARGAIIAFLDDDAIPDPAWLAQAAPYFSDAAIAAVGGPGVTPPLDSRMAQLGGEAYANRLVSGGCYYRYRPGRVRSVDDLPSCNLLIRTDVLRELGGFNTAYWPGEDTILCSDIVHRLGRRIVYDPWVSVAHHRRPLFAPHMRQIGRYALHRGFFAKRFPATSRRLTYMLPSLFVLGLVLGAPLAGIHPWLARAYLCGVAAYLVITCGAACRKNPLDWLILWLGIIATHVVYGVRFLQGILSSHMPCERQRFDHPSEQPRASLALVGRVPFGIGGRRLCFVHPDDPQKCVKVLRQDDRRTVRVKAKYRLVPAWMRRSYDNNRHEMSVLTRLESRLGPVVFDHFPRSYGLVSTDLGPGLVLDLIRDADGKISRSIRELITVGFELERVHEAFDVFGRFLARHRILTRQLLDHNLVVQMHADGAQTIYMIDGLGDPAWLSLARYVPALARVKVARRLHDAWQRFIAFAARGGVTDEMRHTSSWGQGILNFRE